jgi:hypothetical protein
LISFHFNDITGNGLKILLLGSYDPITKKILRELRLNLNEIFNRYGCYTILLENLDIHIPIDQDGSIIVLFENEEDQINCTIIKEDEIVETINIKTENFEEELSNKAKIIAYNRLRKLSELEKIKLLAEWADIIFVIKQNENTRGGELVELTYLLFHRNTMNNTDPFKFYFYHQEDIFISTMVKELLGINHVKILPYLDSSELFKKVDLETRSKITELNVKINRFNHF